MNHTLIGRIPGINFCPKSDVGLNAGIDRKVVRNGLDIRTAGWPAKSGRQDNDGADSFPLQMAVMQNVTFEKSAFTASVGPIEGQTDIKKAKSAPERPSIFIVMILNSYIVLAKPPFKYRYKILSPMCRKLLDFGIPVTFDHLHLLQIVKLSVRRNYSLSYATGISSDLPTSCIILSSLSRQRSLMANSTFAAMVCSQNQRSNSLPVGVVPAGWAAAAS